MQRRNPDLFYCPICSLLMRRGSCPVHGDAIKNEKAAQGPTKLTEVSVSSTDHGSLSGLGDDDHSIYHTNARGDARYVPLGADHGTLTGLTHDDHSIYHTDGRGDLRYLEIGSFSGLAKITVAALAPSDPGTGDLWVDLTGHALKYWDGAAWSAP